MILSFDFEVRYVEVWVSMSSWTLSLWSKNMVLNSTSKAPRQKLHVKTPRQNLIWKYEYVCNLMSVKLLRVCLVDVLTPYKVPTQCQQPLWVSVECLTPKSVSEWPQWGLKWGLSDKLCAQAWWWVCHSHTYVWACLWVIKCVYVLYYVLIIPICVYKHHCCVKTAINFH